MPMSGSIDIPHVSVHDHFIRKPITKKEMEKIKTFVGLFSINEKHPDNLTRAKAYINQYSKFDQNKIYLDSAKALLKDQGVNLGNNIRTLIELCFIKQEFQKAISYVRLLGEEKCLNTLFTKQSYDNADAWASYHVAESYFNLNDLQNAGKWFKQAAKLAPYNLDFRNKYGTTLAGLNDINGAINEYEFIIKENPKYVSAYANLGYLKLRQGMPAEAIRLYNIALKLDPDNEALLLNLAGYFAFNKDKKKAVYYLERLLKKNPSNQKAKSALQQINTLL
jgi:tetratricopeptide (TPR) repeat protein